MWFLKDKDAGEEFERLVIAKFAETFWITLTKNVNVKGVDLVHPLFAVEVKYDRKLSETGNVFIEIKNKDSPSGLFAKFDIDPMFFVIWDEQEIAVMNVDTFKEQVLDWIDDWTFETKNWGDRWATKWLLVDFDVLKEEALYVFTNN